MGKRKRTKAEKIAALKRQTAQNVTAYLWGMERAGEEGPRGPRMTVTLDPPQVTLNGVTHVLTPTAATFLNALIKADDWVSASEIVPQPSRVRDRMPRPVRILIESSPGKGFRIKPPK